MLFQAAKPSSSAKISETIFVLHAENSYDEKPASAEIDIDVVAVEDTKVLDFPFIFSIPLNHWLQANVRRRFDLRRGAFQFKY